MAWITGRWKALVLATGIFAVGIVCGLALERYAVDRVVFGRPPGGEDRLRRRFTQSLDLSDEQQAHVREILETSRQRMMAHRREIFQEVESLSRETREGIMEVLTPDQRSRFEASIESFFKDRRRYRRRPPGLQDPRENAEPQGLRYKHLSEGEQRS